MARINAKSENILDQKLFKQVKDGSSVSKSREENVEQKMQSINEIL